MLLELEGLGGHDLATPFDQYRVQSQKARIPSEAADLSFSSQPCHCGRCTMIPWLDILVRGLPKSTSTEYEIGPISYLPLTRDLCTCRLILQFCEMVLPERLLAQLLQSEAHIFIKQTQRPSNVAVPGIIIHSDALRIRIAVPNETQIVKEAQQYISNWTFWINKKGPKAPINASQKENCPPEPKK